MFMNRSGDKFKYGDVIFTVGQMVVGTDQSVYEGLYGRITEIKDGEDKETENKTPDIYCTFELPVLPHEIEILEKRFLRLTGKRLEDIGLDSIIMAPEMIKRLDEPEKCHELLTIYAVTEDWAANGERGHNEMLYADPDIAKYMFNNRLKKELAEGCLEHWKDKEDFRVESVRDLYEGYLDGGYDENHYTIRTEEKKLAASREFISSIYQISRRHIR